MCTWSTGVCVVWINNAALEAFIPARRSFVICDFRMFGPGCGASALHRHGRWWRGSYCLLRYLPRVTVIQCDTSDHGGTMQKNEKRGKTVPVARHKKLSHRSLQKCENTAVHHPRSCKGELLRLRKKVLVPAR